MRTIGQVYRFLNLLSLDIAAGAVVSAFFFARLLEVELLPYAPIALGLAVWVIYTADHLRDARRIGKSASTARHRFHFRYFHTLLPMTILCAAAAGVTVAFMRQPILVAGGILSIAVAAYLVVNRWLQWTKEFVVAVLYTCGVSLPAATVRLDSLRVEHLIMFGAFATLALTNLLILSWYDRARDIRDGQVSFATAMGRSAAGNAIKVLSGTNALVLFVLLLVGEDPRAMAILLAMNAALFSVFVFERWMAVNDRYRIFGDAVFLLPAVYLLWPAG